MLNNLDIRVRKYLKMNCGMPPAQLAPVLG